MIVGVNKSLQHKSHFGVELNTHTVLKTNTMFALMTTTTTIIMVTKGTSTIIMITTSTVMMRTTEARLLKSFHLSGSLRRARRLPQFFQRGRQPPPTQATSLMIECNHHFRSSYQTLPSFHKHKDVDLINNLNFNINAKTNTNIKHQST